MFKDSKIQQYSIPYALVRSSDTNDHSQLRVIANTDFLPDGKYMAILISEFQYRSNTYGNAPGDIRYGKSGNKTHFDGGNDFNPTWVPELLISLVTDQVGSVDFTRNQASVFIPNATDSTYFKTKNIKHLTFIRDQNDPLVNIIHVSISYNESDHPNPSVNFIKIADLD